MGRWVGFVISQEQVTYFYLQPSDERMCSHFKIDVCLLCSENSNSSMSEFHCGLVNKRRHKNSLGSEFQNQ